MANRFLSNIRINDAYTFPASDGTNGQVIITDGAGNLSFADQSGGGATGASIERDNFVGDGSTTVFYLGKALSDEDQSQVYIDGVYQEKDTYDVTDNTLTFTVAPELGHSVEVISIYGISIGPTVIYQDNFTGDGTTVDFTLGQLVDDEIKTFVFLNGVYQFKGVYLINGTTLTFDAAPANGTAIEVITIASAASESYNQTLLFYGKFTEAVSKGDAIMFAGVQGDHFLLSKATQVALAANHEYFLGLASQDAGIGEFGYVTEFGRVDQIDTTVWTAGDVLWFDSEGTTAGALINTEPAPPNTKIQVAAVIREHQNEGVLFVRPTTYHELGELHDVNITSIAEKDMLVWNSTSEYWENTKTLGDITTGNITTTGTVDGVDVSAFKSSYDTHTHDDRYYTETEIDTLLANSTNWNTAYSWGDHATVGYDKAYTISVISTNTTGVKDVAYILTASLTLTLPASPSVGDKIKVSNQSGTTTPVIARNGQNIQGLAENLVLDVDGFGIEMIYSGATKGWVII